MRAVRLYGIGDLRVEDVPDLGAPAEGWVRVAVRAAGICGSDLHNFHTGQWIGRAPSTPGHELAGEVVAVGAGVADFAPGDRVVADSRFWCGECAACRAGRRNLCERLGYVGEVCDGGFAEAVMLPARLLHKVEPSLDPVIAATAEPLAVALHAIRRLRPEPGAPVLVVGCGPIGGLAALLLGRMGRTPLVADRNIARRDLVADVAGGRAVRLDPADIATAAGGAPLLFAIEATGDVGALGALLDVVANGATVALVGIFHARFDLDPNALVEREIAAIGCSAFADELPEAVALLPAHADAIRRLIDGEVALDGVPDAYRRLLAGEATGLKIVVRPT
jgi:(R,R)-butanediol dehydrogenase/meso-butanediol dehydrogenase/diacetyl reductase